MGFSNDETLLNNINLGSIRDYQEYVRQLRPILLQESGFQETTTNQFIDPKDVGGLDSKGQQRLRGELSIYKGLKTGVPEFEDEYGRRVVRNEKNNSVSFIHPDGRVEATLNISDQLNRSKDFIRGVLDTSTDRVNWDEDTGNISRTTTQLQKTADRIALEERFKKLEEEQLKLNEAQLQRTQKALKGEIPTSETLSRKITDEFNTFKEAQARSGNIIVGDSIDNAVGKGTAAIENLKAFKDNASAAKERELQSIIQGETPLAYGGFQLAQGASGQRAYATPAAPNYGGLSQLSLSGQQPFQFNRNLAAQLELARAGSKKQKSGVGTLIGGLGGAGIGGLLGGPAGAQVGLGIGGGFGSLF